MIFYRLKNRTRSIVKFKYIIGISILAMLLGFEITELFVKGSHIDQLTSFDNNFLSNPGAQYFFENNITFFLIMSILPFINVPIFIVQMLVSGMHARLIADLPLSYQFEIFYRHFTLEYIALLISLNISGLLYGVLQKMHKYRDYKPKNDFLHIILLYGIMVVLTIIVAVLEGGAFA